MQDEDEIRRVLSDAFRVTSYPVTPEILEECVRSFGQPQEAYTQNEDKIRRIVTDVFIGLDCPGKEDFFDEFDFDNELLIDAFEECGSTWQGLLDYFESAPAMEARRKSLAQWPFLARRKRTPT